MSQRSFLDKTTSLTLKVVLNDQIIIILLNLPKNCFDTQIHKLMASICKTTSELIGKKEITLKMYYNVIKMILLFEILYYHDDLVSCDKNIYFVKK